MSEKTLKTFRDISCISWLKRTWHYITTDIDSNSTVNLPKHFILQFKDLEILGFPPVYWTPFVKQRFL